MVKRTFWESRIIEAWRRRPVVWLSGVRRVGKTVLCLSLPEAEYFDCELPSVRRQMERIEPFLDDLRGRRVVLDEIHRLADPSELLKIAADHYPDIRIVATGSSTLQASSRFRDTLVGRKESVWLTPMIEADRADFGGGDLKHRLLAGGLPPFYLASEPSERERLEWLESFWARDIMELFRLERRSSFLKLLELVMVNSGGIFEASAYAHPCEISRRTVSNYLAVLEKALTVHIIRPFSGRKSSEIVAAPRVYAFDTGFVCFARGLRDLRNDDLGFLWEHYVLNEIMGAAERHDVRYWRDKAGHEVDFVLQDRSGPPAAVECKWSADAFDPRGIRAFRNRHPGGKNYCVAADVGRPFHRAFKPDLDVEFVGLAALIKRILEVRHATSGHKHQAPA